MLSLNIFVGYVYLISGFWPEVNIHNKANDKVQQE